MELKGSKTEQNLMNAFAGESQARNKYTYFASKAKKEGYQQIAAIFEETANNEKEHAKMWFKLLNGGQIKSTEKMFEMKKYLIMKYLQCGFVVIVVIFILEIVLQKFVQYVLIHNHILREKLITIKI